MAVSLAAQLFSLSMDELYAECAQAQREADGHACAQAEVDLYLTIYNYRAARGE